MNRKFAMRMLLCLTAMVVALLPMGGALAQAAEVLPDGQYSAEFVTDSGMFHASEACEGKGVLTVKDGQMSFHVSLSSKNILNLFPGTAEDAKREGAALLEPTLDTVTYSDGLSEEVNGFDIPVAAIGEDFDLALIGTKGKWYDHKVSVQNPEPLAAALPADGSYTIDVTLSGGSGRASVESPAVLTVENGVATARIVWSSAHYSWMQVGDTQYQPVQTEGNSTFDIPVELDQDLQISAETTAMSEPHVVEYVLHFDSASLKAAE